MNTPLIRRPDGNGATAEAVPAVLSATGAADGYPLPATWRGIGAQAAAALGMLAGPRGFAGLQSGSALLGVWLIIAGPILNHKHPIADSMHWSNSWAGGVLIALAAASLAAIALRWPPAADHPDGAGPDRRARTRTPGRRTASRLEIRTGGNPAVQGACYEP